MPKAHLFDIPDDAPPAGPGDVAICGFKPRTVATRRNDPQSASRICGNCARLDPGAIAYHKARWKQEART